MSLPQPDERHNPEPFPTAEAILLLAREIHDAAKLFRHAGELNDCERFVLQQTEKRAERIARRLTKISAAFGRLDSQTTRP